MYLDTGACQAIRNTVEHRSASELGHPVVLIRRHESSAYIHLERNFRVRFRPLRIAVRIGSNGAIQAVEAARPTAPCSRGIGRSPASRLDLAGRAIRTLAHARLARGLASRFQICRRQRGERIGCLRDLHLVCSSEAKARVPLSDSLLRFTASALRLVAHRPFRLISSRPNRKM